MTLQQRVQYTEAVWREVFMPPLLSVGVPKEALVTPEVPDKVLMACSIETLLGWLLDTSLATGSRFIKNRER